MRRAGTTIVQILASIARAVWRARIPILLVALVYVVAVATGTVMVHSGNCLALARRDRVVARAQAEDPSALALQRGERLRAGLIDFARNLGLGAVPDTVGGLGIVFPLASAAYRGWVGGIVSVDGQHVSRLADPGEAFYYLLTLVLQLIPYSLAGGAGINLGWTLYRPRACYQGERWLGLPKEALRDVLRIYLLIVPLFLVASLWEFLAV